MKYREYLSGTREILERSQEKKSRYYVRILNRRFVVLPGVFSPKYFRDTEIFARNLPSITGQDFLEIGCGTGVISIMAVYKGAGRVVATDINPAAVANCRANARLHHMGRKIEVRGGDLFSPIGPNERFDIIFWNTPFGYGPASSILEQAVFDPGYRSTHRLILESREYLKKNGRLLIGFSSTLGKLHLVKKFCEEAGLALRLIYYEWSEEVCPVRFELFEAK